MLPSKCLKRLLLLLDNGRSLDLPALEEVKTLAAVADERADFDTGLGILADNSDTSLVQEPLTLEQDVLAAGVRVILAGALCVLEGRELVLALHLHAGELVHGQEGEAVEHELLELDAVGLLGLDLLALVVDAGNLLLRNVVGKLVCPVGDALEETEAVVVVDNVGGAELEQAAVLGVLCLGELLVDLAVFDNGGLAVLLHDETDALGGVALADHLGGDLDILLRAKADEGRVGDTDKAVVHAVSVNVLDTALLHVLHDTRAYQSLVETTVSVRCHGDLALVLQQDLAVVADAWEHTLLEEDDVVPVETEVLVLLEELLRRLAGRARSHDVPR